jgi:hypothetical protein
MLRSVAAFAVVSVFGCATTNDRATRRDYSKARNALIDQNPALALSALPTAEQDSFVASVESGWLHLLAEKEMTPQPIAKLLQHGDTLDDRKTLYIGRETASFFYKDAADGYYPAEHEAILLHLVTAMHFAAENDRGKTAIEVRRAARYLESDYSPGQGFDDAGLRIWLAALWLYLGRWDDARIDLRHAAKLAPQFAWLEVLAARPGPPPHFAVVFSGPGPEVSWNPGLGADVVGEATRLEFASTTLDRKFYLSDFDGRHSYPVRSGYSTQNWYLRHQERDHLIRDVLDRSEYALRGAAGGSLAGATFTLGATTALAIGTIAVATGVAVFGGTLYLAAQAGLVGEALGYAASLGLAGGCWIGGKGIGVASDIMSNTSKGSASIMETSLSKAEHYRYIRFLPDYIYAAVIPDRTSTAQLTENYVAPLAPFLSLATEDGGRVQFYFSGSTEGQQRASVQRH